MNILKTAAVVAVGLAALVACQQAPNNTADDESAIRDGTRAWAVAYNAGDTDGVVSLYAEDAVVMPPGAPAKFGRAAIREYIATDSAAAKAAGVTITIEHGDSVGIAGDVAWHSGPYSVSDASGTKVDSGNYMEALQKKEGKWHIVRDLWNSEMPPPSAPVAAPEVEPTS